MRVEVLENVELHCESDIHTELGSESLTLLKVRYMETSTNTLFQREQPSWTILHLLSVASQLAAA